MKKKLLFVTIIMFSAGWLFSQALDEDFESGTWPPAGWTEQQIGDPAGWLETTDKFHSSSHSAFHNDDDVTTGCNDWLISPVMDLSSYTVPQLTYWEYVNWAGSADEHNVLYSTDYTGSGDPALATWTTLNFAIGTEDTWVEIGPYTLPASASVYVAFQYTGDYASEWWIDDVSVNEAPSCLAPTDLAEADITTTTVDLSWTETGTAITWDIEYAATPYVFTGNPTITGTTDNPYALSGLSANIEYTWQVRANCGGGDVSDWSDPNTFTTQMAPISVFPYTQDFDGTWSGSPAAPEGWTVVNANSDAYLWSQANTWIIPTHSPDYAAHGMGNTDDYLITPAIDLTGVNTRIKWWDKVENAGKVNSYRVLVSTTTPDIASFTIDFGTYDCSNTLWTEHILDLSAYAGQTIYVAFYQFASASAYYGFGIDDFSIEEVLAVAPNPATISFPTDGLVTFNDPLISWTPSATGEPATGYKVYLDENNPPTTEVYDDLNTEFQTSGLSYGTQYYWKVVPYNATGDAVGTSVWSFTTVGEGYLAESFESTTFPPAGWSNPDSWSRSTLKSFIGDASAYKYTSTTEKILRTPLVTITGTSTLNFFARLSAIISNQCIQIKYSTDNVTFLPIGSEISLPSSLDWNEYSVDLSSLAGSNCYLAIATYTTGSGTSLYVDHVIGPMITPLVPDAVTLTSPADEAVDQIITPSLSWTTAISGGVPTGYKIYLDENANPTTLYDDVALSPYDVTPALDYGTTYYWRVVAYNATGDGATSLVRSFTTEPDPTLTPPFTEDFSTWYPTDWSKAQGLLAEPVAFSSTTNNWDADGFGNVGTTGAAKINIWGTSRKDWMITPPINLGDGSTDYRLTFDLALTYWNSASLPETDGIDDKFAVVISTDNGATWTSANNLMLWDNEGSACVYNAISNTGETIVIDLSSYSGLVKLAFYGESTITNADNDLFVDNVTVEAVIESAIWTGATNNDWATSTNWNPGVPQESTTVTIPAVANNPTLATLTTVASVTMAEGATIVGAENLTITGDFTTTRNVAWYDEYHYLSSPVGEITIEDAFPNGSVGAAFYMYGYDEPSQTWVAKARTDTMVNGMGYNVYRDANAGAGFDFDIDFTKDSPVWADVTFTNLSLNINDSIEYEGWHLLGNPFPAGLDWDLVTYTNIENAVYTWDGDAGGYISYNDEAGLIDGVLPVGQGFMVKANNTTNTITLPTAACVHSALPIYKANASALRLDVTSTATTYHDATFVRFATDATTAYDNAYDARKLFGLEEAPALYTQIDEQTYSINSVNEEVETIALNFKAGLNGSYTITATDVMSNGTATLEDLQTGEMVELDAAATYTFDATTTDNVERFVLHIKAVNGIGEQSASDVNIYSFADRVYIETQTSGEVEIYNISGQLVRRLTVTKGLNSVALESGIYIVRLGAEAEKVHIQ